MINDNLGAIANAHLVHADHEESKARSLQCLLLANLHSAAVDFAKTGSPAEMPRILRPKQFPDFMERWDRPMYPSSGALGKLYRAAIDEAKLAESRMDTDEPLIYDSDLEVEGFDAFLDAAKEFRDQYSERLSAMMNYYGAETEDEILTGNLRNKLMYLQKDKQKYGDMRDRMLISVRNLHKEVETWFKDNCDEGESAKMASAWYHVTYHPNFYSATNFLSFPWILCDILLNIKDSNRRRRNSSIPAESNPA
jgi:RNA-dependent RNA polymerase